MLYTPHVVDLVILDVPGSIPSGPAVWSLQLPMVEAVQEHLSQVVHCLPLLLIQVAKFVHHKVRHTLQYISQQHLGLTVHNVCHCVSSKTLYLVYYYPVNFPPSLRVCACMPACACVCVTIVHLIRNNAIYLSMAASKPDLPWPYSWHSSQPSGSCSNWPFLQLTYTWQQDGKARCIVPPCFNCFKQPVNTFFWINFVCFLWLISASLCTCMLQCMWFITGQFCFYVIEPLCAPCVCNSNFITESTQEHTFSQYPTLPKTQFDTESTAELVSWKWILKSVVWMGLNHPLWNPYNANHRQLHTQWPTTCLHPPSQCWAAQKEACQYGLPPLGYSGCLYTSSSSAHN